MEWEVNLIEWMQANLDSSGSLAKFLAFLGAETGLLILVLFVMFCWKKKAGQKLVLIVACVNLWLPMIKSVVLRPRPYMEHPDRIKPLVLDSEGAVTIHSSGDKVVCLGGGRSAGEGIHVLGGALDLSASGINVIGIGSSGGSADIELRNRSVSVRGEGNDVVLIGSGSGSARITAATELRLASACERVTGIGTLSGHADILLSGSNISAAINCDAGAIIGTLDGEAQVTCRDSEIYIHGEGNRLAGFGSLTGACDTRVESGHLSGDLLAGERLLLGNENSRFIVTGGNIRLFHEGGNAPVSPAGLPLHFANPKENHYEAVFRDPRAVWTYRADRDKDGYLGVWILP